MGTRVTGVLLIIALVGCSSTGVIESGADSFIVSKRSAQVGFGEPIAAKADILQQANAHCAKLGKVIERIREESQPSGFGRPGSATLEFRCVSRP